LYKLRQLSAALGSRNTSDMRAMICKLCLLSPESLWNGDVRLKEGQ